MAGTSRVVALGLAAFLIAGTLPFGPARAGPACQAAITDHLESLNIDAGDVTRLKVYPVKTKPGRPFGYHAWVSLKACRGNLIINLSLGCRADDAYTRGDCMLENVKQR